MADQSKTRRQKHGIQAQQITITLPGDEMERLRQEAAEREITVSRHVVELIRSASSELTTPAAIRAAEGLPPVIDGEVQPEDTWPFATEKSAVPA